MTRIKGCLIALVLSFSCVALPISAEQEYPGTPEATSQVAIIDSVNINTATAEQLSIVLNGVGMKRAQAIVDYRETNGPFIDVDQLREVKGIGDAIVEKNRNKIRM